MVGRAAAWVVPAAIAVVALGAYVGSFLIVRSRFSEHDDFYEQFLPVIRREAASAHEAPPRECRVFVGPATVRRVLSIVFRPCMLIDERVTRMRWSRA